MSLRPQKGVRPLPFPLLLPSENSKKPGRDRPGFPGLPEMGRYGFGHSLHEEMALAVEKLQLAWLPGQRACGPWPFGSGMHLCTMGRFPFRSNWHSKTQHSPPGRAAAVGRRTTATAPRPATARVRSFRRCDMVDHAFVIRSNCSASTWTLLLGAPCRSLGAPCSTPHGAR